MKTLVRPQHETVLVEPFKPEASPLEVAKHARLVGALAVELMRHAPIPYPEYQSLKNEHRARLGLPVRSYNAPGAGSIGTEDNSVDDPPQSHQPAA